ncbi:MAG: hypothetical protein PCFJNLEI_01113 [Verrucomicrobiae bacterium]|nr:hypothetical protein [Verrucomicrobiae bacterium]
MKQTIEWTFEPRNPVIRPRQLHGEWDLNGTAAGHVLDLGDCYRMYYWGSSRQGNVILMAESPKDRPNDWRPRGGVLLGRQLETEHNHHGPGFPFVFPVAGNRWHMVYCGWGKPRPDGVIPNTTNLAVSDDAGLTWRYQPPVPMIPLDQAYDQLVTGSVWVVRVGDEFRMYYTALGEYIHAPPGVKTGHGEWIPRIGIGYATSHDGLTWQKPFRDHLIAPRGFDADPYEYINSKPCVIREEDGWRMFISTFGHAYRVRSLVSADGLHWERVPSGPAGDLGVGAPGAFDDHQRSYASVIKEGDRYHLWYTGNRFGATGMGYACGRCVEVTESF